MPWQNLLNRQHHVQIVRHLHQCPERLRGCVVALGNFDGVHLGHQAVIRHACILAKKLGTKAAVMTFEPHPSDFFGRHTQAFRIETFQDKVKHLEALGVDVMFLQTFNAAFSQLSAEAFIEQILVKNIGAQHVITGENFVFGHKRSGNVTFMQAKSAVYGFGFSTISPVLVDGDICSSTNVRECLQHGEITKATQLLGRPYTLSGRVRQGEGQGKQLGFPTANIALKPDLIRPALGVYAVYVTVDDGTELYPGVANIGRKPTFGTFEERLEVHLFTADSMLYEKHICVQLVEYLRPEKKFDGVDALVQQINQDVTNAQNVLNWKEARTCS